MTSNELLSQFRSDLKDQVEPYLWSSAEVYRYLDDAQKMFCRLTDGIADATTTEVIDIPVAAGATWLDLHPSILKIRAAYRTSDGRGVDFLNYEDLPRSGLRLDGTSTAPLSAVIVGMEENKLRLARIASAADTLRLMVFRLPLAVIDGADAELEIPEQHHLHLLDWVKSLALLKQDSETFDAAKSEEHANRFRGYCTRARTEQQMKRHKVRTVAYGGI